MHADDDRPRWPQHSIAQISANKGPLIDEQQRDAPSPHRQGHTALQANEQWHQELFNYLLPIWLSWAAWLYSPSGVNNWMTVWRDICKQTRRPSVTLAQGEKEDYTTEPMLNGDLFCHLVRCVSISARTNGKQSPIAILWTT